MHSDMADAVDSSQETTTHCCPTISLAMVDAGPNASTVNPARILGHLYAEELYREAALYGLKSGTDMKKIVGEDLAVSYGFCSPESSLLMLYDSEQFEEHGISPPVGHPARQGMETGKELKEYEQAGHLTETKAGEIGGLKNEAQRAKVIELSLNLKKFFAEAPVRQSSPQGGTGNAAREGSSGGSGAQRNRGGTVFSQVHQSCSFFCQSWTQEEEWHSYRTRFKSQQWRRWRAEKQRWHGLQSR
jgi:hypothetical protein